MLNNKVKDNMAQSRLTRSTLRWTTLSAASPQRGLRKESGKMEIPSMRESKRGVASAAMSG